MKQKVLKLYWDNFTPDEINRELRDGWRVVQIIPSHPALGAHGCSTNGYLLVVLERD